MAYLISDVYLAVDTEGPLRLYEPSARQAARFAALGAQGYRSALLGVGERLEQAAEAGDVEAFHETLIDLHQDEIMYPVIDRCFAAAAAAGHIPLLEYMRRRGLSMAEQERSLIADAALHLVSGAIVHDTVLAKPRASSKDEEDEGDEEAAAVSAEAQLQAAGWLDESTSAGSQIALLRQAQLRCKGRLSAALAALKAGDWESNEEEDADADADADAGGEGAKVAEAEAEASPLGRFPAATAEVLYYLLAHCKLSADRPLRASDGWGPLHLAADAGRPDLVAALLTAGVDPNPVANEGETPMVLALRARAEADAACARALSLQTKAATAAAPAGRRTASRRGPSSPEEIAAAVRDAQLRACACRITVTLLAAAGGVEDWRAALTAANTRGASGGGDNAGAAAGAGDGGVTAVVRTSSTAVSAGSSGKARASGGGPRPMSSTTVISTGTPVAGDAASSSSAAAAAAAAAAAPRATSLLSASTRIVAGPEGGLEVVSGAIGAGAAAAGAGAGAGAGGASSARAAASRPVFSDSIISSSSIGGAPSSARTSASISITAGEMAAPARILCSTVVDCASGPPTSSTSIVSGAGSSDHAPSPSAAAAAASAVPASTARAPYRPQLSFSAPMPIEQPMDAPVTAASAGAGGGPASSASGAGAGGAATKSNAVIGTRPMAIVSLDDASITAGSTATVAAAAGGRQPSGAETTLATDMDDDADDEAAAGEANLEHAQGAQQPQAATQEASELPAASAITCTADELADALERMMMGNSK